MKSESVLSDLPDNQSTISNICHKPPSKLQDLQIQFSNNNNNINISEKIPKKTFKNALPQVSLLST